VGLFKFSLNNPRTCGLSPILGSLTDLTTAHIAPAAGGIKQNRKLKQQPISKPVVKVGFWQRQRNSMQQTNFKKWQHYKPVMRRIITLKALTTMYVAAFSKDPIM
jgi:hypothetical protein